jgi:hypothetical protein
MQHPCTYDASLQVREDGRVLTHFTLEALKGKYFLQGWIAGEWGARIRTQSF